VSNSFKIFRRSSALLIRRQQGHRPEERESRPQRINEQIKRMLEDIERGIEEWRLGYNSVYEIDTIYTPEG
jgi:hypothetical protein